MSGFYSQFGEDQWIASNISVPPCGTFSEVGAYDGVISSNTLYFEERGWEGIVIEPDPRNMMECYKNRKCGLWPCAVGKESQGGHFLLHEDRALSHLINSPGFPVFVFPLDTILATSSLTHLDLLSIDTEGTELDVWASIGEIRPAIVIIEYNTLGLPKNDVAIVAQFTKDGYKEVHRTEANIIFTREQAP